MHTFHLPLQETTISLEDIVVQLGLPIDGEPVMDISSGDLVSLRDIVQILGARNCNSRKHNQDILIE